MNTHTSALPLTPLRVSPFSVDSLIALLDNRLKWLGSFVAYVLTKIRRAHRMVVLLLALTFASSANASLMQYTFQGLWTEGTGTISLILDPLQQFNPSTYPVGHTFPLAANGQTIPLDSSPPVAWGANTSTLTIYGDVPGFWQVRIRDSANQLLPSVSNYLTPVTGPWTGQQIVDSLENGVVFDLISTSPVPEPSTYLAGLSALAVLGLSWRKRK